MFASKPAAFTSKPAVIVKKVEKSPYVPSAMEKPKVPTPAKK